MLRFCVFGILNNCEGEERRRQCVAVSCSQLRCRFGSLVKSERHPEESCKEEGCKDGYDARAGRCMFLGTGPFQPT